MENINYRYQRQMEAEGGARLQETLCVGEQSFSPELRAQICSQGCDTNAGRTAERFNKPDWDRNYFWLPQPKRLINGIFMKGAK